jgi:hypothetical protein
MALGPCRECGKQVSSEAEECPNCGIDSPIRPIRTALDTIKAVIRGLIATCVFLIIANVVLNMTETAKKEEQVEQQCLAEHPLNPSQFAARKHFSTCWQYRHTPSSVWSDNRRMLMLAGEGCYSDDRDDPRNEDADWDLCKSR